MRRAAVTVLVSILVLLLVAPARAQPNGKRIGALAAPIRLVPNDGTLRVEGLHDYYGTIVLKGASDGLVVVDRLPLEDYLLGLNEVPTRWPEEALEAQAIAARTYALWTLAQPPGGAAAAYGFDICASVQCQVFAGADVIQQASQGDRWRAAVRATSGEAVLFAGEPILARYHSTSGGETFANEQIFLSEGPFPYLKGVTSTEEEASPLYRWFVDFSLADMQKIVRRAGLLPSSAGRLREVRTIASAEGNHYPDVALLGRKGDARITAETLRVNVRTLAPALFPNEYPSFAPTSSGRLPEVFPSNRLSISTEGRTVKVVGRGWGHGVGMSQWGAEGMARRGATAEEILTHYYTGVSIGRVPSDGPIEVGVAWGRAEVVVSGDMKLVDRRGNTIVPNALGTWRFRPAGAGAVSVSPPKGFGLPLKVGIVKAPNEVIAGRRAKITVALSRPARLKAGHPPKGTARGPIRPAGRVKVGWKAPALPGEYVVRVVADDGSNRRGDRVRIAVVEAPQERRQAEPAATEDDATPIGPALLALAALITVAFAFRKVTMRS